MPYFTTTVTIITATGLSLFHPAPPPEGWAEHVTVAVLWAAAGAALLTAAVILLLD